MFSFEIANFKNNQIMTFLSYGTVYPCRSLEPKSNLGAMGTVLWIRNDLLRIQLWIFRVPDPKSEPDPTHNIQAYLGIIKITPYSVHMITQKEESTKYEYLPFSISH